MNYISHCEKRKVVNIVWNQSMQILPLLKVCSFTLTVVICDDLWSIFSVNNLTPRKDENIEVKGKEKKASTTEKDVPTTLEQSINFENNTKIEYRIHYEPIFIFQVQYKQGPSLW